MTVHPGAYQRGSAISIHTSAREVTQRRDHKVLFFRISIHTSAREVTLLLNEKVAIHADFNPHFRKGSDRSRSFFALEKADFNPHFRKGSDGQCSSGRGWIHISIHTSAREVTWTGWICRKLWEISIHTSAREVTEYQSMQMLSMRYFNPHFRKGSDQELGDTDGQNEFQSTLPQGK